MQGQRCGHKMIHMRLNLTSFIITAVQTDAAEINWPNYELKFSFTNLAAVVPHNNESNYQIYMK